ncbi:NUDIX hydrolase [Streptomyces sp. NPDC006798]|uniref:NUDIX hydrolase n=1 Tax=Streptomyces sp. NPDC006798 TaxID=3155462 RepID=UPI0033F4B236
MTALNEPSIATGVVLTADPDPRLLLVLLTTPAPGMRPGWQLPGGKIETGEGPRKAAVREIDEETGLKVRATGRSWTRIHPETGRRLHYVHCIPTGTAPAPVRTRPGEISGVVWAPLARLGDYIPHGLYTPVEEFVTTWAAGELA